MKIDKKNLVKYSHYLMYGAVTAVILAGVGWLGQDIWLASTQWLLVALVLAVFGLYLKLN